MSKVVAVRKNGDGTIAQYKLEDGTILDAEQAVEATALGKIEGCSVFTTRDGHESIRSARGHYDYALRSLPEF